MEDIIGWIVVVVIVAVVGPTLLDIYDTHQSRAEQQQVYVESCSQDGQC